MDDCIEYQGRKVKGYGIRRKAPYTTRFVHRQVWMEANGSIPPEVIVRHLCNNPSCVNIDHLAIGTHADNARDRGLAGNTVGGGRYRNATHCVNGHEFTPENTHHRKSGGRTCKTCSAERLRAWRAKRK